MRQNLLQTAFFTGLVLTMAPQARAGTGLTLLKVESGARPSAMGEAFVSIAGDPLSQRYNPAATVGGPEFTAYLGHTAYWENVTFETAFMTLQRGKFRYSFGARLAQISDLEARSDVASVDPLFLFESRDISLKFGVAYPFSEKLSIGVAGGWIIEKISFFKSSSFNMDIGALYSHDERLSFGLSVANVGQDIRFVGSDISLPTTVRAGASYRQGDFLLSADGIHVDDEFHAHVGAEYTRIERLALRAGFQSGYDSKNVTAGLGFSERDIRVDYAFVPYRNDLGTTHQFGLSILLD
ncbi:MAG: PorV/PorQ family protein [Candidatus Zixiibacteriota bacterium]